jgi:hypothetical protein
MADVTSLNHYARMTAQHKAFTLHLIREEGLVEIVGQTEEAKSLRNAGMRRVIDKFLVRFPNERYLIEKLRIRAGSKSKLNPYQILNGLLSEVRKETAIAEEKQQACTSKVDVEGKTQTQAATVTTRRVETWDTAGKLLPLMRDAVARRPNGGSCTRQEEVEFQALFKNSLQALMDLRKETGYDCKDHVKRLSDLIDTFCKKFPHMPCCIDYQKSQDKRKKIDPRPPPRPPPPQTLQISARAAAAAAPLDMTSTDPLAALAKLCEETETEEDANAKRAAAAAAAAAEIKKRKPKMSFEVCVVYVLCLVINTNYYPPSCILILYLFSHCRRF